MRPNGSEVAGDAVRPDRPRRHRHRRDPGHRPRHRRGLRVLPAPRSSSPAARPTPAPRPRPTSTRLGGEALGVPTHLGELDAAPGLGRRHRRALRRPRHRRQQRRQRADPAARRVHARGVGEVVRREPARPGLPRPGGAAPPQGEPARRGGQRDLGGSVPGVDRTSDVLGGEGGDARVHPGDGARVGAVRHPGQRARARHRRHRHGAQQPARSAGAHGRTRRR